MQNANVSPSVSTNIKQNKLKKYISLVLVAALIITGLYAFLVAQDTKENVFEVGKVEARLMEECDTDIDSSTPNVVYDENDKSVEFTNPVFPGDVVYKSPWVENMGSAAAYVVATIAVPNALTTNMFVSADGEVPVLNSGNPTIKINAYVFQDGYKGQSSATDMWTEFNKSLGTAVENPEKYSDLFIISDDTSCSSSSTFNNDWSIVGEPLITNGYTYYTIAYANKLDGKAADADLGVATSSMFNYVTLNKLIGKDNSSTIEVCLRIPNQDDTLVSGKSYAFVVPDQSDKWVTENGAVVEAGDVITAEDLKKKIPTETGVIYSDEIPILEAVESDSSTPKLVPVDSSSPAIIDRKGVVETYVDLSGKNLKNVLAVKAPDNNSYETPESFAEYYIYGYQQTAVSDALENNIKNSLKVVNGGYFEVSPNEGGYYSTGTTIKVYDTATNSLTEVFHVVLFGDVNGDALITGSDGTMLEASTSGAQSWTKGDTKVEYTNKSADINGDDVVNLTDSYIITQKTKARLNFSSEFVESSAPVKLVPKDTSSTAMIERNGVVETWNNFSINPHIVGVSKIITPCEDIYVTPNYDKYYIYGLKTGLTESELAEYIKVQGNGHYSIELNSSDSLGTGAKVIVYEDWDETDVHEAGSIKVEEFYIVIFGDVDGDSYIRTNDKSLISHEVSNRSWSSNDSKVDYLIKAADISADSYISGTDGTLISNHVSETVTINQKTGQAN